MIGIREMSPMMMSFGAHRGSLTGQTKASVMRSNYAVGVEIVTSSRTNQIKAMMAPAAVATMPRTQADIAKLRPPSAPAEESMRLFSDLPMKYAIGPQTKPGMPSGSPITTPTI